MAFRLSETDLEFHAYPYIPETILKFLYDHIDKSADNQARVKWEPATIVLWDNRITAHVRPVKQSLRYSNSHIYEISLPSLIMESLESVVMDFG